MQDINHNNKLRSILVLAITAFTNALFLGKYLPRYTSDTGLIILLYLLVLAGTYWLWNTRKQLIPYIGILIVLGIICIGSIIGFSRIQVEKLNVDRWSVIYNFFDAFKKGIYPYSVRSNMSNLPGPMPFYFLVAYPFYVLKEIGYMPLLALVAFCLYQIKKGKKNNEDHSFALILLLCSPFMIWEIFARSTVFFVSVLWYIYADWLLSKQLTENKSKCLLSGFIGGILLSTRFIYVLVIAVYAIYFLRNKVKIGQIIAWGAAMVVGLVLTLLPLYIMYPKDFLQSNPFQTESLSYMPFWLNFLFPFMAIAFGLVAKNKVQAIYLSGMVLLSVVALYFGFHVVKDGWTDTFYNSYADISYFIIPMPFLLGVLYKPEPQENK